jgi:hypothetical protein
LPFEEHIVKLLLADERVDPVANTDAAIRCASNNGHLKIVKVKLLLADERVNLGAKMDYTIRYSSENGHMEIVKQLLPVADERVDLAADENYAIRHASQENHLEIVKLLLGDEHVDTSAAVTRPFLAACVNILLLLLVPRVCCVLQMPEALQGCCTSTVKETTGYEAVMPW